MREIGIIIRREFLTRVRTRAFLIGTVVFPVFMAGIFLLPTLVGNRGGERTFVVVDETDTPVGQALVRVLGEPRENTDEYRYNLERVPGPFEAVRAELNARVLAEEIDGYIVLPAGLLVENTLLFRARNIANRTVLRDVTRGATRAVQAERLRLTGLTTDELIRLLRPVQVEEAEITAAGEAGRGAIATFFYAYIVAFLNYFMVAIYGLTVLRSVLEEKTNRISEVLVSSVRGQDLMLGKIVGASSAAVLQVGIWVALTVVMLRFEVLTRLFGVSQETLRAAAIGPGAALLYITFFVLGFLVFAALFAALGAAMTTEQEAQSMQMVVMLPLFVPMLFLGPITNDPLAPLATTLSLIPFTAPIAMPMRLATAPIPAVQVAASLLLLAITVLAVAWVAGKVYRIGILSTGRRPTLRELGRWLVQA